MNEETAANGFSEHHQRQVRTTFQYIDKLLSEAEHTMADAGSLSPFRMHSDDTTPIQRKVTHDYILRIGEAMRLRHGGIGHSASRTAFRRGMGCRHQPDVLLDLTQRTNAGTNARLWTSFGRCSAHVGCYLG